MKPSTFISWSGARSRSFAHALCKLLDNVETEWGAWTSDESGAGSIWNDEIMSRLRNCQVGIVCLTRENLNSQWLLFESGALASTMRTLSESEATERPVCPVLIGPAIDVEHVPSPLVRYNAVRSYYGQVDIVPKDEIWGLVETLDKQFGLTEHTGKHRRSFDQHWEEFDQSLRTLQENAPNVDHAPVPLGDFQGILRDIKHTITEREFEGDLYIYNIETYTIMYSPRLWDFLFQCDQIKRIHLAIPPAVVKRLENYLRYPTQSKLFRDSGTKLQLYPLVPDQETKGIAYGFFDHTGPSRRSNNSFIYELPKAAPYARLVQEKENNRWDFTDFIRKGGSQISSSVVDKIKDSIQKRSDIRIDDLIAFNRGDGLPIQDVLHSHGIDRSDPGPFKQLVGFPISSAESELEVELDAPEKPILLWLPPWGQPLWGERMSDLDKRLAEHYEIIHVRYRQPLRDYSFSSAERDFLSTVRSVRSKTDNPIVVVATSVNGFVAVSAAPQIDGLQGLMLLSSAVDLFDAIDAFHERDKRAPAHLFSRRMYHARGRYRASGQPDARYFGVRVRHLHTLDLRVRGRLHSDEEYFKTQLGLLLQRRVPVCFGHSREDDMVPYHTVESVVSEFAAPYGVDLIDIAWKHDLGRDKFFFPVGQTKDDLEDSGLQPILERLTSWAAGESSRASD